MRAKMAKYIGWWGNLEHPHIDGVTSKNHARHTRAIYGLSYENC